MVAACSISDRVSQGHSVPMRMLQVCAVDFTAYHLLSPLMRGARDAGWEVEFACARGPWVRTLEDEGFRHRAVPIRRSASPTAQLRAAAALGWQLRRDPPALIHTHTPAGGLVGRAASFAVPTVPVVHTFHGLPFEGAPRRPVERAFVAVERVLARRTAFFFSQAEGDLRRACDDGYARRHDSLVIGNGIAVERFAPDPAARAAVRAELGLDYDDVLILSIGRLVREKGHLDLAEAALSLGAGLRPHVAIAGAALPSDRTGVEAELREHPAALSGRVRLLGHRADAPRLLAAADIFVLASYREGLPRSVIEAMAAALPVVVTDIPACRELVEEGASGLLVPPREPAALARALARLVGDPALRQALGARSRQLALERHHESDVIARQLAVLARLMPAAR